MQKGRPKISAKTIDYIRARMGVAQIDPEEQASPLQLLSHYAAVGLIVIASLFALHVFTFPIWLLLTYGFELLRIEQWYQIAGYFGLAFTLCIIPIVFENNRWDGLVFGIGTLLFALLSYKIIELPFNLGQNPLILFIILFLYLIYLQMRSSANKSQAQSEANKEPQ